MIRLFFLIPVALLGWIRIGFAQDLDPRMPKYRHPVIKIFPLSFIDPFQYTLHMGVEVPTSPHNSVQIEGGWVFGYLGDNQPFGTSEEEYRQRGLRARAQWREYFLSNRSSNRTLYTHTGGYIALLIGYQYYHQNLGYLDTSQVYPPQPTPTGIAYERHIQGFSGGFLFGYQNQIGSSRIVFDAYTGIGVRYTIHEWQPLNPPYLYRYTPIGEVILRRGGRPILYMGFSVGWVVR
ncbi:MAG: hypothetical protein RMK19_03880 [Bacteroidia bacterium]|nr:hypothetical protein [Bacteroidia bacterium]MDW8015130.1 hypothetical protein [Bacteroidia bacterium]